MAELVKQWDNGGSLSVTYEGSGDGSAVFSSDTNEGIDREMSVLFKGGGESIERKVTQEGLRQPIALKGGGVFRVAGGGRFGVLKVGGVTPDEPTLETYTRLSYIECTGTQYFNLGYVLQSTDTIEAYYDVYVDSTDKFLFGSAGSNGSTWLSLYSTYAYVRFGQTTSKSISNGAINHYVKATQKSVVLDATTTTLDYVGMPTAPLFIFAGNGGGNDPYNHYVGTAWMIKITDASGNVLYDLRPVKRDSDGKVGMLDIVSGKFFVNEGGGVDFIAGTELLITDEYELIDRVAFDNDIAFDTGYYGNEQTYIDVLFQRTDTSGADYLFGCLSGNRLTGYLTSSGYWRYGSAAPTFNTNSKKIYKAAVTPTRTTIDRTNSAIRSVAAFTTSRTIPVGGYKSSSSSDTITRTYQGYVYYFKMKHGSEQLLEWYPCKRKSDGEVGFWDCVTQKFIEKV